jgi:hypothetical protein
MKTKLKLDQETLKSILRYDPDTGIFTWLWRPDAPLCWNTRWAGTVAGTSRGALDGRTYWVITVDRRKLQAHRLAVLYMTGEWPTALVDHEDLDGINNRWENLRDATPSQNAANAKLSKASTSGLKGVWFHKQAGRYRASICVGGRRHSLGLHDTAEAAHVAYCAAAEAMHGEFARAA